MLRELQHHWWLDWQLTSIFQWHSSYKLLQGNIILKISNHAFEISIVPKYVTITVHSKFSEYITTAFSFVVIHSWETVKGLSIIKFLSVFCTMWISQAFKKKEKHPLMLFQATISITVRLLLECKFPVLYFRMLTIELLLAFMQTQLPKRMLNIFLSIQISNKISSGMYVFSCSREAICNTAANMDV